MTERAYRQNPRFFHELAVGPEMRGIVLSIAEDAKTFAERLSADIRSNRTDHEHYADSFETDTEVIDWTGRYPGPRVTGVLRNTSGHAAAVEYGYRGRKDDPTETSAHHILGRTLQLLSDAPSGQPEHD